SRSTRQEAILGVRLELVFVSFGRLPVGGGRHHQTDELLHIPTRLTKLYGQPVEQLRMRRRLALRAEVLGGPHQTGSEDLMPEAIPGAASRRGMRWIDQPFRQAEPIARQGGGHWRKHGRRAGLDFIARLIVLATEENVRLRHRAATLMHDVRYG